MRARKLPAPIGSFERLEDRLVLSGQAANEAIVKDVTSFYSNYVATIPALVQDDTSATAGTSAQTTAASNLSTAITDDVNDLATALLDDLGASATQAIALSISGNTTTSGVTNTTGSAAIGSLLNALLAVNSADPAFLGTSGGIALITNLALASAQALASGGAACASFPAASFGSLAQTYYGDVQAGAAQLATDQAAAGTSPTAAQQTAIDADIAAIDTKTVDDVNTLATDLLTTVAPSTTAATDAVGAQIRQSVSGSTATSGVTYTGAAGSTASYGSLLATLQAIETDPALLSNSDVVAALVAMYAYV